VLDSLNGQEYTPVGISSSAGKRYMPNIDLPGDDYNVTDVNYTDPTICQRACDSDSKCVCWTYVTRPPLVGSCCLKNGIPNENPNPTCTSGIKIPDNHTQVFIDTQTSSLNSTDGHKKAVMSGPIINMPSWNPNIVVLQIFVDHSSLEVYANGGRTVISRRAYPTLDKSIGLELFAGTDGECTFTSVEGWNLYGTYDDEKKL